MANDKESFILYLEQEGIFDLLEDEEAGKLIKVIFEYERTGIVPKLDKSVKIAFMPIKNILDRNAKKWEQAKERRSIAGKKGMASRWHKDITDDNNVIKSITNDNNVINDITNDNKRYQSITKITVNDNVNVNVNDNVNNNIKENIKRKVFVPPCLEDIQTYINEKGLSVDAQQFYDYFTEGKWIDAKGNKVKNWKQKLLTWNKYSTNTKSNTKVKFQDYEQRTYEDLSSLYANQ